MFQATVITLREGVEAALIVGIVLAYLDKTQRRSWKAVVYWALAAAIVSSLVAAYFVHRLQVAEEAYEGWLMLLGALFLSSMVLWMWRAGKRLKQEIETRLSSFSPAGMRGATLGLFLFVFFMVLREGIETVLFLAAVSFRTSELLNFMGGMVGLGLAVGLGIGFFKGSLKVDLRKFFAVTSLVLLVVTLQLLVGGIHELSEGGFLPSSQREMALVGPVVNNDAFFFVVIVALAVFLLIAQRIQGRGLSPEALAALSPPERRKAAADERRDRRWKMAASAVGLTIMTLIVWQFIWSRSAQAMTPPERIMLAEGAARIPVSELADRKLHRFVISVGGAEVRVIAVLDATDTVRAAFDACAICGAQGYYQDGANVICRNCSAAIYVPTIGVAGGCNPIHVDYVVENDFLVLGESALAAGSRIFR